MRLWAISFLLGVLTLQFFSSLPSIAWLIVIVVTLVVFRNHRILIAYILGFSWAWCYASLILSWQLPHNLEGKPLLVKGYIASIPNIQNHRTEFLFKTTTHAIIKLSWQNDKIHLNAGDEWQFKVRLKQIHGLMNPGGFDYEAIAFQESIRAQGYVVSDHANQCLSSHAYHFPLTRIRQHLKEKLIQILPPSQTSPWIIALALGERNNIPEQSWQVLRNTGTNHLMVIAGLHIGFMAGFIYFIVNVAWRRVSRFMLILPAQHAAAIASLCMALIYSMLAGFSIPTQRACIMLSAGLIAVLLRKKMISWHAWCIALLFVLFINPASVLSDSFWLSFASVALIIYGISGRLSPSGIWWKVGRIQWVVALGLIPLGIWLFQQCSFVSFIANSIAIPWVGFLIVPLTLLGCLLVCVSTTLGAMVLIFADKLMGILWNILSYLAHLHWASWYLVLPHTWMIVAACIGTVILLLPAGFPGRYVGLIGLLPLLCCQYPVPKLGEVWFTLLDVGQGLSAVVQTQKHILVFDAGAKLGNNYDMGESVVTPFLRTIGSKKIDLLVISHSDNDHIGGVNALLNNFSVLQSKTSVPEKLLPFKAAYCLQGDHWEWDGVKFEFLYPTLETLGLDNDSSCVLRITTQQKSILLTGDIEKFAEKKLLTSKLADLKTDILIAPHHGSKTSAVNEFVDAVHPQYVLFPIGYRNRYHFPHPIVVQKYQDLGAKLFSTDQDGAISFCLSKIISTPSLYRILHNHYWSKRAA